MTVTFRLPLEGEVDTPPLVMPDQNLRAPFTDPAAPGTRTGTCTRVLRLVVLTAPLGLSVALGWISLGWFAVDGWPGAAELALVGISVFAVYWVALSFAVAMLGLLWWPDRPSLRGTAQVHAVPPSEASLSVAILLPMYGEPAGVTIGNAVALLAALAERGTHRFTLHVLSDTRQGDRAMREMATVDAARRAHPTLDIRYRRRPLNTDYKSGNIRDWVTCHGDAHDAMLILDADSVMGAASVHRMADLMAAAPQLGLIQSAPRVLPGQTVWQRAQSFASEVYGLNLARGFAIWAGVEGNFLGHNALVRTRAFAACAGLPHLPGRPPRGGVILSHDFVEAALLRRAGWGVRMLPDAAESYEATPETLPGYLRRDRRWCQGNMQHLRLLAVPGLHPVSRFHLLQGAMAYLASVWWMALLGLWAFAGRGGGIPDYFSGNPLMHSWPVLPALSQTTLVVLVALLLLGPKIAGVVAHLRERGLTLRQAPGFAASVLAEIALSILIAPALMVHQVRAVLRTLAGFDGGWAPHAHGRPPPLALLRVHAAETVLGLGLLLVAATGGLTPWLLPVAVSLAVTAPLSWLVQRDMGAAWLFRPLPVAR